MKRIKALIAALLIGGALVAASPAMAADKNTHLDVQGGFTSQSGNLQNYQGIFNVQGTLSKEVNSKLTVFGTLGEDRVVNTQGVTQVGGHLVGLPSVQYGQIVFDLGGQLNLSPVTFAKISYGQRPSDLFLNNANTKGIRELSLTVGTRIF